MSSNFDWQAKKLHKQTWYNMRHWPTCRQSLTENKHYTGNLIPINPQFLSPVFSNTCQQPSHMTSSRHCMFAAASYAALSSSNSTSSTSTIGSWLLSCLSSFTTCLHGGAPNAFGSGGGGGGKGGGVCHTSWGGGRGSCWAWWSGFLKTILLGLMIGLALGSVHEICEHHWTNVSLVSSNRLRHSLYCDSRWV